MDSVNNVNERFRNTVSGFFLDKRVACPVTENYVNNTWNKFGLVKSMMNSKRVLFFKFNSHTGWTQFLKMVYG